MHSWALLTSISIDYAAHAQASCGLLDSGTAFRWPLHGRGIYICELSLSLCIPSQAQLNYTLKMNNLLKLLKVHVHAAAHLPIAKFQSFVGYWGCCTLMYVFICTLACRQVHAHTSIAMVVPVHAIRTYIHSTFMTMLLCLCNSGLWYMAAA